MLKKALLIIVLSVLVLTGYSEKKDYILTDRAVFSRTKKGSSTVNRVKCTYCNGKGFKKVTVQKRNRFYSYLKLCPICRGKGYMSINVK